MPVFDQYEVETVSVYSGSYTDTIIISNPVMSGNVKKLGIEIGTAVAGLNSDFNKVNLTYNDRLQFVSGGFKPSPTKNTFTSFVSTETIVDSLVPSPVAIVNANGFFSPNLSSNFFQYGGQTFGDGLPGSQITNIPAQSDQGANLFFAGDLSGDFKVIDPVSGDIQVDAFIDQTWVSSPWPFKSLYKSLNKIKAIDSSLYPEPTFVSKTPVSGSDLAEFSYNTEEIGGIYIALGAATGAFNEISLPVSQYSQIYCVTASSNTGIFGPNGFCNRPVKSWNNLNEVSEISFDYKILFGTVDVSVKQLLAVGDNSTILFSKDNGFNWNNISSRRSVGQNTNPGSITYSYDFGGGITGTKTLNANLNCCLPVYDSNSSGGITALRRWLIGGDIKVNHSFLAQYNTVLYRDHDVNDLDVSNLNWETVGSISPGYNPSGFLATVEPTITINTFATNNISGSGVASGGATDGYVILAAGSCISQSYDNTKTDMPLGELHYSNDGGLTWNACRNTDDGFDEDNFGNITGAAYGVAMQKFVVVGYKPISDASNNILSGTIGRSDVVYSPGLGSPADTINTSWTNITGSTLTISGAYAIDIDNGSSGYGTATNQAIVVGLSGSIYFTSNIAATPVTWTKRTPAGGYNGTFRSVKRVYSPLKNNSGVQIYWIACGDDGEIQYTTSLNALVWIRIDEGDDEICLADRPTLNSIIAGYPGSYPGVQVGTSTPDFKKLQFVTTVGSYVTGSLENFKVSIGQPAVLTGSAPVDFSAAVGTGAYNYFKIKLNDSIFGAFIPKLTGTSAQQAEDAAYYVNNQWSWAKSFYKNLAEDLGTIPPASTYIDGSGDGFLVLANYKTDRLVNPTITILTGNNPLFPDALPFINFANDDTDSGVADQYGRLILARIGDAESNYYNSDKNILFSNIDNNSFLRSSDVDSFDYTASMPSFIKPRNDEIYKTFFGFGDGLDLDFSEFGNGNFYKKIGGKNGLVNFNDISFYSLYKNRIRNSDDTTSPYAYETSQIRLHNPIMRGWRYGLYNGIPTNSKVIYRRNRFGQFRDILEGRPTVAFQNAPTSVIRTFFYPVEINFVSGTLIYSQSIDYVTATNPDYNPYDSGIYDKFYRSGQPFFDRNNED